MKSSKLLLTSILLMIAVSLLTFACRGKQSSVKIADQLIGNTYEYELTEQNLIRTIHFNESTFTVYESGTSNLKWTAPLLESNKLILDRKIVELRKINESEYKGVIKGNEDIPFVFRKKVPNWSVDGLMGNWMFEKTYHNKAIDLLDDESRKLMIGLFSIPEGMSKKDFVYYPYFRILNDQIIFKQDYDSIISSFEVIEEEDFMALKLGNSDPYKANYIKILAQNDTLLCYYFVDRLEQEDDTTQYGTPKLIKIR